MHRTRLVEKSATGRTQGAIDDLADGRKAKVTHPEFVVVRSDAFERVHTHSIHNKLPAHWVIDTSAKIATHLEKSVLKGAHHMKQLRKTNAPRP